jgi:predicted lactoylglutathione lyase
MCNFFEGLTDEQGEKISKAKGTRGVQTKETIILNLLNQYYKEFQKAKQMKEVA